MNCDNCAKTLSWEQTVTRGIAEVRCLDCILEHTPERVRVEVIVDQLLRLADGLLYRARWSPEPPECPVYLDAQGNGAN